MKATVDYYILYNIELRQPRVGYRYVARRFRVGKLDLQEEVEACFDVYRNSHDEDSEMYKKNLGSKKKEKKKETI